MRPREALETAQSGDMPFTFVWGPVACYTLDFMDPTPAPVVPSVLLDVPSAPAPSTPSETPEPPPRRRIVLRSVRPVSSGDTITEPSLATPAPHLTSIDYDSMLPLPPVPPEPAPGTVAESVHFRVSVTLAPDDARTHSVRLLMARLKAVLDGELLTPPERAEATWPRSVLAERSQTLQKRMTARECDKAQPGRPETGRPRYPRRGILTAEDGRSEYGFWSMVDLVSQLKASYAGVNAKYLKACREAGVDPNDHDGVDFTYKECKIHLKVRW